jgi:putative component of membrane protein insertase Oxa1/YidC/SpoIIIJ protein YidD
MALVLVAAAFAAVDVRAAALGGIHAYHRLLAPIAARAGVRCRLTPTCSRYAEIVIARDGVIRGGAKTIRRLARCGVWTAAGTRDEP